MDFGRLTLGPDMVLYMFGTPGQDRFLFLWDELVRGAVGGIVLVDTRRIEDCFPAVDYFEHLGIPFVVAVNLFNGVYRHHPREVREALSVPANVPVVLCDARNRLHVKETLVLLVEGALRRAQMAGAVRRNSRPRRWSEAEARRPDLRTSERTAAAQVSCAAESEPIRQVTCGAVSEPSFWVETLGCPKNAVDSDKVVASLLADGLRARRPCPGRRPGRRQHLRLHRSRPPGVDRHRARPDRRPEGGGQLVVTGCMAERYGDELAAALPEVDAVVGFAGEGALADWVPVARARRRSCPKADRLRARTAEGRPRPARAAPARAERPVGLPEGRRGLRPRLRVLRHPVVPRQAALADS